MVKLNKVASEFNFNYMKNGLKIGSFKNDNASKPGHMKPLHFEIFVTNLTLTKFYYNNMIVSHTKILQFRTFFYIWRENDNFLTLVEKPLF